MPRPPKVQRTAARNLLINLRVQRAAQRLSQEDLARKMQAEGFTTWCRQTVSQIERGQQQVTVDQLDALAAVFGVDPTSLLRWNQAGS